LLVKTFNYSRVGQFAVKILLSARRASKLIDSKEIHVKKIFLIGFVFLATACNMKQVTPQMEPTPTVGAAIVATQANTVTPAPTRSAPPTSVLSPTPVPLHFTEEFNTDMSAWGYFQTGGAEEASFTLANDALDIQMTSPHSWTYALHNAHEYVGVTISAKGSGTPSGALGLVCNYSEAKGWYEFNITHEGTYSVLFGQWLGEGIAQYRPILNATSEYLEIGKLDYEIGLTCNNDTLFLQVDGKMFRKVDVARFELSEGKVGLSAASFDNVPMNANFEWFKVGPPEQ